MKKKSCIKAPNNGLKLRTMLDVLKKTRCGQALISFRYAKTEGKSHNLEQPEVDTVDRK